MRQEIGEQAAAVERLLLAAEHVRDDIASFLPEDIPHILVAARGTSDNAARYAQYVWGARNALTVGLATPSLFGVYERPPSLSDTLVVAISQSGESPDLIAVLEEARRQRQPTLAITNTPQSALGRIADKVVDLHAGEELAVAATKTYTCELVAIAFLSTAFSGEGSEDLDALPELINDVLEREAEIASVASTLSNTERCVVVGRGFHFATAHEWALKLQETTYVLAQPYSAADFLHGPSAVVDATTPVLLAASAGPTLHSLIELTSTLKERGVPTIAVADAALPTDHLINIPKTEHEWLSPIVAAPAIQLFSYDLARQLGQDPDHPRGLSKVTRTT